MSNIVFLPEGAFSLGKNAPQQFQSRTPILYTWRQFNAKLSHSNLDRFKYDIVNNYKCYKPKLFTIRVNPMWFACKYFNDNKVCKMLIYNKYIELLTNILKEISPNIMYTGSVEDNSDIFGYIHLHLILLKLTRVQTKKFIELVSKTFSNQPFIQTQKRNALCVKYVEMKKDTVETQINYYLGFTRGEFKPSHIFHTFNYLPKPIDISLDIGEFVWNNMLENL